MAFSTSSGNSGARGRRAFVPMAEINVTPMVDVTLVLLIIFIITAPLLTTGVVVNLPQTRARSLPQDNTPYQVTVEKNGDITIGTESKATLEDLNAKISAALEGNRDLRVYIRGDYDVPYGYMMEVASEISAAGITQLGFVTVPKSAPR